MPKTSEAQRRAAKAYRKRQREKGFHTITIRTPETEVDSIRDLTRWYLCVTEEGDPYSCARLVLEYVRSELDKHDRGLGWSDPEGAETSATHELTASMKQPRDIVSEEGSRLAARPSPTQP